MAPSPKLYTLGDVTLSVSGWAKRLGISREEMRHRLREWPIERALSEPSYRRMLTHGGVTKSAAEWAREAGITQQRLNHRLARGWSLAKVLKWGNETPPRQPRTYTVGDRTLSIEQWAEVSGLARTTLVNRLRVQGMTMEQAIATAPFATVERFEEVEVNGERHTLAGWADGLGLSAQALSARIKSGWTVEEAVTTPKGAKPERLVGRKVGRPAALYTWGERQLTIAQWSELTGLTKYGVLVAISTGQPPPVKP